MIALLGLSAISRLGHRDPLRAVMSLAVAWPLRAELPVSLRPSIEPYRNELVRRLLRSGRRSPTSAVRPSSRARSRALDPRHTLRRGERRVPKHAPAETTEIRRSTAHVSCIRGHREPFVRVEIHPSRRYSRPKAPLSSPPREGKQLPRDRMPSATWSPDATSLSRTFHVRTVSPSDLRHHERLAPPASTECMHEAWQRGRPTRSRLFYRALEIAP